MVMTKSLESRGWEVLILSPFETVWKDLECKVEDLHTSASLEVKDLMERVSKSNEKNRRLQSLCEQQSQQLNKNTAERKQQLEDKKSIKSKLREAQEFAAKLVVSENLWAYIHQ